jgi:hypothetical protein
LVPWEISSGTPKRQLPAWQALVFLGLLHCRLLQQFSPFYQRGARCKSLPDKIVRAVRISLEILRLVSTLFSRSRCFFLAMAGGEIKRASIRRACTRCGVSCKVFDCSICVVVGVLFAHMYHFIGAHSSRGSISGCARTPRGQREHSPRCLPNINLTFSAN